MDYRTQFDFFEIPNFESLIEEDKLIPEDKKKLDEYESFTNEMDSKTSKKIIDIIFDSNDYNIHTEFDFSEFLSLLKTIDFTKIQRYKFDSDVFNSDIRYRCVYGNKFLDSFIKFGNFKSFKVAIDFIRKNYPIEYVIYMLDYGFLMELKQRYVEPHTMIRKDIKDYPLFDNFKIYFDYFVSIGLMNSIDFLKDLFTLFSTRHLMFSRDYDCKKIFRYVLESVKPFKIFFSNIPIHEIPVYVEYFKLAYSHGLNVHSDLIDKITPSVFYRRQDILDSSILTFLYSAGRDAMKDLILLGFDSGALLQSMEENKQSDFIYYLSKLKYYKSNSNSKDEKIPIIDDYKGYKLEVNYSNPKAIQSVNVILDFARLSDHFPKRLRLTEQFLQKIRSIHSEEFIQEVKDSLQNNLNNSIIDMILSY
jgi:hypothetical protein